MSTAQFVVVGFAAVLVVWLIVAHIRWERSIARREADAFAALDRIEQATSGVPASPQPQQENRRG